MADSVISRLKSAWNIFSGRKNSRDDISNENANDSYSYLYGAVSSAFRPDRVRLTRGNERSIINSIYNRIAVDVSALTINHVRLDNTGGYSLNHPYELFLVRQG